MNAFHWGHLEFFICNAYNDPDAIPTQECFNQYPLTRAEGDDDNSPIDPNFPGRYYCDPTCRGEEGEVDQTKPLHAISGENMKMRYVLPDIECSHCILQMVYHTGNTCYHIGYEEFNPPSWPSACAPNKEGHHRGSVRPGGLLPGGVLGVLRLQHHERWATEPNPAGGDNSRGYRANRLCRGVGTVRWCRRRRRGWCLDRPHLLRAWDHLLLQGRVLV
ncbi:unnamed protein product [Ectocarpus sp. 4 AP-2014]